MNVPEQPTQAETKPVAVNARRKLIRGAFALPAVTAVHSASALAVSSSLRCLRNAPADSTTPGVLDFGDTESPTYKRIPLAVAKRTLAVGPDPEYLFYVDRADVLVAALSPQVGISASFGSVISPFRRFDVGNNSFFLGTSPSAIAEGYALLDRASLDNNLKKWVVVTYNDTGTEIVGAGVTNPGGFFASESCWTSFGL